MNKPTDTNIIVVIRATGERTKEVCRQLVLNELSENNVFVIECIPFEEALRESYRIGINSDKEWMITIDADVLPRRGFINHIKALTENVPDKLFTFKALIFDKLFLTHRMAGFRVYRNRYLETAYELIPENGTVIRPESYTIRKMEQRGYKTKVFDYVVGLHDYEQYYRDIYRKAYFHATKHPEYIADSVALWKEKSGKDPDYLIALKGALDGLLSEDKAKPDIRFYRTLSANAVKELKLIEKSDAYPELIPKMVESVLEEAGDFYKEYAIKGIRKKMSEMGIMKGFLHTLGYFLEVTGAKIKKVV